MIESETGQMKIPVTDEPNRSPDEQTPQPEPGPESVSTAEETEAQEPQGHVEEAPDPLQQAQEEAAHYRDLWMRAVAELENYKKRVVQERSTLLKYRNEDLMRALIPVKDNLERALEYCEETEHNKPIRDGVVMIANMLGDVLRAYGITEIQALGNIFDPHRHEAISQAPSHDQPPNTVIQELEKGYMYHDRLLRPSKVVVSTAVAQPEDHA